MATFEMDDGNLVVTGRLDSEEEEQLKEQLAKLMFSQAEAVTIDLAGVKYIASSCVGALVTLWIDLCSAQRKMKVIPSAEVKKVMDIAGLTALME